MGNELKGMKVLVIARGYPSKRYPMNGIFEFDQAKALAEHGHDVIFAAVDMRSIRRIRSFGFERFIKDKIQVYAINLPIGRVPSNILSYFTAFGLKWLYKKIVKEQGIPTIMHAHFPRISLASAKLKKYNNLPLIVTEHSSGMMSSNIDPTLKNIASEAYDSTDLIIAVSPGLKAVLETKFNKPSVYIPNIVDTSLFKYTSKATTSVFTFITVGSLITRKRMDLTIAAFYEAFNGDSRYKLFIIGAGPLDAKLKEQVAKLELNNQIVFLGSLERSEIAKYMHQSDCFVLPSQAETFGVVYIEALSSGLPVIATVCGGPETFVNETNGILIEVDNQKALTQAMLHMSTNITSYDRSDISKNIMKLFSPEIIAKQLTDSYQSVLKGN